MGLQLVCGGERTSRVFYIQLFILLWRSHFLIILNATKSDSFFIYKYIIGLHTLQVKVSQFWIQNNSVNLVISALLNNWRFNQEKGNYLDNVRNDGGPQINHLVTPVLLRTQQHTPLPLKLMVIVGEAVIVGHE